MNESTDSGHEDHRKAVIALRDTPPVAVGVQEMSAGESYRVAMYHWSASRRKENEGLDEQAQETPSSD